MPAYETLDLLIEKNNADYSARIVNSPVGQARVNFALPFTADELKTFFARVAGRAPTSGSTLSPKQLVEQMGTRLFNAVFHDEVLSAYRRSRDAAEHNDKGLRVRLRLNDVPELADLPWEFLYDATRHAYLALSKETPIVRYLELPERVEPLAARAPIKLLAVLASPNNRDALDVEGEWTRMHDALQDLVAQNKITLTRVQPPTLNALQTQLRKNEYHILHFIGHGDFDDAAQQGSLVFETDARPPQEHGDARSVSEDVIATLLRDARALRVVVLNACQGAQTSTHNPFAGTAPRLVQAGIPAVLAMQYSISDQAALDFSSEFYKTLADGFPIDAAMNEARRAVYFNGNVIEWGTPVLFMRAEDGVIFQQENEMSDNNATSKKSNGVNISGGTVNVTGDLVGGGKTVHGDEINADGDVNIVNIGAGAQVGQVAAGRNISQTQGASVQDLAALFNAIYKQIDARPNDPNVERSEIRDTVKNIETEAAKGANANPNKIERWFKALQEIAPDILEVTANAIISPASGVASAIKKIAEKMRAEK